MKEMILINKGKTTEKRYWAEYYKRNIIALRRKSRNRNRKNSESISIRERALRKKPNGLLKSIYRNQKSHSKYCYYRTARHSPDYSLDEFLIWTCSHVDEFYSLFEQWVMNNYDKKYTPSIDRIDRTKGYTLDNIQLMTWADNHKKGAIEMANLRGQTVAMMDSDNNILRVFPSMANANAVTGITAGSICNVCNGKNKSAGGYLWKKTST